jgi:iron complex outermembrane recepter protein
VPEIFAGAPAKFRGPLLSTVAACALLAAASGAQAQTTPVETITVTAQHVQGTAVNEAPTSAPLDATQPTSVISQDFIEKNLPLSGNYDEAIQIAPSVSDVAPNGPGLAESQAISIRGFQDGQFNVTFDGIPWGDSNDFTHHTTSYFMAHDLGQISVDRGPGTASTIGNATFGGTVSVLSKAPSDQMSINPYVSFGSFNTQLYGVELDSGTIESTGGTRIMADGEGLTSDGYLTNMGQQRENGFIKIVQPIGADTELTLVGMYNTIHQNISLGATAAEIAKFGPNFALLTNPNSQNFAGYNNDQIHTDFEYADINSNFGDGWNLNAKVYTYGYFHVGRNGEDPNGETPNGTSFGANDVPGQLLQNDYRSVGTITRFKKDLPFGDIQVGLWYDHQANSRGLFEVDETLGGNVVNPAGAPSTNGVDRELHQDLETLEPYLQVDWQPIDGLTLSPGLRYAYFDRSVDAQVNVKDGLAQSFDNTFDAVLPSITALYKFNDNWSAYAQAAEGFLAQNENFFNFNNPSTTTLSPEQSWNYQIGTSWQTKQLAASVDAYYIDFSNFIGSQTVQGITTFFNQGGAVYKGLEAEATYSIGYGVSLYANGSINSAKDKQTGLWLQNAPNSTGALGVIYDKDGIYGSLIEKWVGSRYGDTAQQVGLDPYGTLDMALGYTIDSPMSGVGKTTIKLQLDNLLDTTKIFALAGNTVADNTPLFWTVPGRSAFVTISTAF